MHHETLGDSNSKVPTLSIDPRMAVLAGDLRLAEKPVSISDWWILLEPGGLNVERVRALHHGEQCLPN